MEAKLHRGVGKIRTLGTRLGAVQRSKGQSAIAVSAYGHSGLTIAQGKVTTSTSFKEIASHKVYLPIGANLKFKDPHLLWSAAEDAEIRKDAVLARRLDLTLPRVLQWAAMVAITEEIAARFIKFGVPVQVDIHITVAADGQLNPHVHFLIAERRLLDNKFENKKNTSIIATFRTGFGRPFRRRLASIVNSVAFQFGHTEPLVTPFSISKDGNREPRLPRFNFKGPEKIAIKELEKFRAHRSADLDRTGHKMDDAAQTAPTVFETAFDSKSSEDIARILLASPEEPYILLTDETAALIGEGRSDYQTDDAGADDDAYWAEELDEIDDLEVELNDDLSWEDVQTAESDNLLENDNDSEVPDYGDEMSSEI